MRGDNDLWIFILSYCIFFVTEVKLVFSSLKSFLSFVIFLAIYLTIQYTLLPLQVENGLIVVVYKDGSPAHAHCLNSDLMSDYWKSWLVRLEEFNEKRYCEGFVHSFQISH